MEFKKILIPTDFSEASKPAMARGLGLANQMGATPCFLHIVRSAEAGLVVPMFDVPPSGLMDTGPAREAARQSLADAIRETEGNSDQAIAAVEEAAYIPTGILTYAEEHDIDLIVMGTHGRQGVRRFILGSVAEEIVRKAPCAVLTVGAQDELSAQDPAKILGAVDLEEGTKDVVRAVLELSARYDAEMEFLHVVPPIHYLAYTEFGAPVAIDPGQTLAQARRTMCDRLGEFGVTEETATLTVESGIPDASIVERAEKVKADLIVVTTHARVGLPHVLLGSVADRVLRTAKCPVLTVLGGSRKTNRPE